MSKAHHPTAKTANSIYSRQGGESGSELDPESTGSVDPDSKIGSGSRRAKETQKRIKIFRNFMF